MQAPKPVAADGTLVATVPTLTPSTKNSADVPVTVTFSVTIVLATGADVVLLAVLPAPPLVFFVFMTHLPEFTLSAYSSQTPSVGVPVTTSMKPNRHLKRLVPSERVGM